MNLTYQQMQAAFQNSFTNVHPNTYWDLAIAWHDNTLIGCYEAYNLMHIAADDNKLLDTIEYYPGISIFGCKFKNIRTDEETRKIIEVNGGRL